MISIELSGLQFIVDISKIKYKSILSLGYIATIIIHFSKLPGIRHKLINQYTVETVLPSVFKSLNSPIIRTCSVE